ncbi:unnamed protein product [Moneuplotes crassus]|uniref:Secreted protein n=1 Tax=Euplotes crassus TaxID=5936 RepID=A0AAD1XZ79_EUPCR|nr:unnamed protein product [Moneuplotes crassus]
MKVALLAFLIILVAAVNARSFNTYSRTSPLLSKISQLNAEQTPFDFYRGFILGWQTQQSQPGQCYNDNGAFFSSLNDTWTTFKRAYRPDTWFNFLDRIRINIDNFAKSLQSCQMHSILTKMERIVTSEGILEVSARLISQIVFLQNNIQVFMDSLATGEYRTAGIEGGKFLSAIIGVTVN